MSVAEAREGRGPLGETRSIGLSILWAILTLGIYTFIWVYRTQEETQALFRERSRRRHRARDLGSSSGS